MKRFFKTDIGKVLLTATFIILWIKGIITFVYPILFSTDFFGNEIFTAIGAFVLPCIVTPLWEEAFYRHIPFLIANKVNKYTGLDFTFITMLLTSFIFALAHTQNGIMAILLQGVAGFALSCLYVSTKRPYLSCVLVHALWNIAVFYVF